ncbi:hypothetical protein JHD49_05395 [Sulfurimonas sp. SAG-AH-194-C21]|nr:hypothetical protein [Sulfurimonas sp. SAG-AH-194-C21]MDF1883371.1 hypothetical protein [Sulfurimonas sp. SAG-AH-194-C21]
MAINIKEFINARTTPLASIFGSGFLVMVPILVSTVGSYATLAMFFITLLAYSVGSVIRFNIKYAEPILKEKTNKRAAFFEHFSDISLVLAYVVSVSLYLNILSAFVLTGLGIDSAFNEKILTSSIIVMITAIGIIKGLKPLEILEKYALEITIFIVVLLIAAFGLYDYNIFTTVKSFTMPTATEHSTYEIVAILAGMLIVVQGFETSRYLGESYSSEMRIMTSRYAQIVSTIIYLIFISLALPVTHLLNGVYSDNSLIELVTIVAPVLVIPLIVVAALSQFSAAVADTLAATGNIKEVFLGKVNSKMSYLLVGVSAVGITWSIGTLEILALASRAFAFYYLLQTLVAISISKTLLQKFFMSVLALILVFITLFAIPAG